MAYKITTKCISCDSCVEACPFDAISKGAERYEIDANACVDCGSCTTVCKEDAIEAE